jgi:hypothetical protein
MGDLHISTRYAAKSLLCLPSGSAAFFVFEVFRKEGVAAL